MMRRFELLETMRWTPEAGFYLLDRHLARLQSSADYFGFTCLADVIGTALDGAVRMARGPLRVRLLVADDGRTRVEQTPLDLQPRPLRLRLAAHPIDPNDEFLYHKTTNRAVYERARRAQCDDVVLWNPSGEATESTIANLVAEFDGRRMTPPVSCGLLPGTMRAELLAGGELTEGRITLEALRTAARIWLVNSVRGWCEALLIDE